MGTIYIEGLKVRTLIGAHPWERLNKQEITIYVAIDYDATAAGRSDKLKDALDYEHLTKALIKTAEKAKSQLLEHLAAKLLKVVLADKRVIIATIKLDKPQAIAEAQNISFQLTGQN